MGNKEFKHNFIVELSHYTRTHPPAGKLSGGLTVTRQEPASSGTLLPNIHIIIIMCQTCTYKYTYVTISP